MIVRRATTADEAAVGTLWAELDAGATYTPYPGARFSTTLLTEQIALVAEAAGEPIGCVYAATPSEHYGFVFGLYVRPSARRQGVARKLMHAVAEILRDGGRQHIVLSVDTPNAVARSLYDQLGSMDAARTLRIEIDQLLGR